MYKTHAAHLRFGCQPKTIYLSVLLKDGGDPTATDRAQHRVKTRHIYSWHKLTAATTSSDNILS